MMRRFEIGLFALGLILFGCGGGGSLGRYHSPSGNPLRGQSQIGLAHSAYGFGKRCTSRCPADCSGGSGGFQHTDGGA